MCPPAHFAVTYAINPWMHPGVAVDVERALAQWHTLRRTYRDLGHRVDLLDPVAGLPDMVYAANGATVVDGVVYGARFRFAERGPEAAAHRAWFRAAGYARVVEPEFVNEGEGDLLVAGGVILAGSGFRTDPRAHAEAARVLRREVVPLEIVGATTRIPDLTEPYDLLLANDNDLTFAIVLPDQASLQQLLDSAAELPEATARAVAFVLPLAIKPERTDSTRQCGRLTA